MGVALNTEGRAHFDAMWASDWRRVSEGPLKRMSASSGAVGRVIPNKWRDHPEVVKLRKPSADDGLGGQGFERER